MILIKATEESEAGQMPSEELLTAMGVPRVLLPRIVPSSQVYGEATGVLAGVPVAGALGAFGITMLYRGLAIGRMGIVAPVTGVLAAVIPVMAGFLGAEEAVVIMAIPTVVTNTWLLWVHRREARAARHLPVMLAAGTVGVVLGAWYLTSVTGEVLALSLAVLILGYVALSLARPELALPVAVTRWLSPPVGFVGGVLQGATGIAGPAVATYVHGFRLRPGAYVFAIAAQFQLFAAVSVVAFLRLGLYSQQRLLGSLLALVPVVVVLPLGVRLGQRLDRRRFDLAVLVVLILMGIKLLVDGLAG
jgi:uncharacterized membrane protein YfcA